jgi:hypothetical protein
LNKNIWNSFKRNHTHSNGNIIRKALNRDQNDEYDLIKKLSEKLIVDNYHRNPTFEYITKRKFGYNITRKCRTKRIIYCRWNIDINMNTNEAILSCNKQCQHENPIKHIGLV